MIKPTTTLRLPPNFSAHVNIIVASIFTHIEPILRLKQHNPSNFATEIYPALYDLVASAGILSLHMRVDPHTVYYFTPVFKEDNFRGKYMESFNHAHMVATHPRDRKTWPPHVSEDEKRRAQNDDALTQITIMDGVTAYRVGGWETSESDPWRVRYAEGSEAKGIRSRILTHGWVCCRWGRARRFVDGRPKDDPKVHGAAWKHPGFVEFRDVEGVGWGEEGLGRKGSGAARRSSGGSRRA